MQTWVEGILDRVIGWLAEKGRALLKAIGIGGDKDKKPASDSEGELGETVKFSAGGESHRMWVQTEGAQATLMVASGAATAITAKLDEWSEPAKLELIPETGRGGTTPRKDAKADIKSARSILKQADKEADKLAKEYQKAQSPQSGTGKSSIESADDQLEATEKDLSAILKRLFDAFDETADPQIVFAHQLDRMDSNARKELEKYMKPDLKEVKPAMRSWNTFKKYLQEDTAVGRAMFDGPLSRTHEFGKSVVADQIVPAVQDWMKKNKTKTVDIEATAVDFVEGRKGQVHAGVDPFTKALKAVQAQIFENLKKDAATTALTLAFTKKLEEEYPLDPAKVFKAELKLMHKSAQTAFSIYLKPDSEEVKAAMKKEDWATFKKFLEETPRGLAMNEAPLSESHDFGQFATDKQAVPALKAADVNKIIQKGVHEEYVTNRKGSIHNQTPPFGNSVLELRTQIFDGAHAPTTTKMLTDEFKTKLEGEEFAELNHPAVIAELNRVAAAAGADWVAVFATGGLKLRQAPVGRAQPKELLMKDVWKEMGTTVASLITRVADAAAQTIKKDKNFLKNNLPGQKADVVGRQIATRVVNNMGKVQLFYVKNTDIPRYVEGGAHVKFNTNSTTKKTQALYTKIAENSKDVTLSALAGEIHHVIPLYLGGSHNELNLMMAEGHEAVASSAHHEMHAIIDELNVEVWVNNNVKAVGLEYTQLAKDIPRNALKIIIGTLFDDGSITYEETKLVYDVIVNQKKPTP